MKFPDEFDKQNEIAEGDFVMVGSEGNMAKRIPASAFSVTERIGVPNGVAGLNGEGKVPSAQLPTTVASREYSVDFGEYSDMATEGNISNALQVKAIMIYNIATLKAVINGTTYNVISNAAHEELYLLDGGGNTILTIPQKASVKWVITRITENQPASATIKFEI